MLLVLGDVLMGTTQTCLGYSQRAGGGQEAKQLVMVLESSCTIDVQEGLNVCMQEGEARPHKNRL